MPEILFHLNSCFFTSLTREMHCKCNHKKKLQKTIIIGEHILEYNIWWKKFFISFFWYFTSKEQKIEKKRVIIWKKRISGLLLSSVLCPFSVKNGKMTEKCGINEKIRGQNSSGRNDKTSRHSFLYANWTLWYSLFQKQKNNFPKTYFSWVKCVHR